MNAIAMHVCHWECGDAVLDQVMTMQDQIQTWSRPKPTHTQNFGHEAQAPSTVNKVYRIAGQPRCGCMVRYGLWCGVDGGKRGLGGACTPDATNFQPSPQIELGGSLTSDGSLTWQQRCNHNSNTIDPMTAL